MSQQVFQSPRTPRSPPERKTTLGPSTPIHDWEVEHVRLVQENSEFRERAERLEKKVQQDRATYERNTASLLREVKMKESLLEKRVQDVERQLMEQIQVLQRQLLTQQRDHEDEVTDLKARFDQTLAAEQTKHERRLAALQERLKEKDLSIRQSQEGQHQHQEQTASSSSDDDDNLVMVKRELARERSLRQQKEREWQQQRLQQQQQQKQTTSHDQELQRLRELFLTESQHQSMLHEARVQNLKAEYEETLKEVKDQFAAEKAVWAIEKQTAVDRAIRMTEKQKDEEIERVRQEWRNKLMDLEASMSEDATQTQAHWQTKVSEATRARSNEAVRLKGEIAVVKDRLGKEIQRRKQVQAKLDKEQLSRIALEKKQVALDKIYDDYRMSFRLGLNLLAMTTDGSGTSSTDQEREEPLLADVLLKSLHACQTTSTLLAADHMECPYSHAYYL